MAANYAKIRDGGKGAGLHYRTFEGFSKLVALRLRKLRREDFQIATRIREVRVRRIAQYDFIESSPIAALPKREAHNGPNLSREGRPRHDALANARVALAGASKVRQQPGPRRLGFSF